MIVLQIRSLVLIIYVIMTVRLWTDVWIYIRYSTRFVYVNQQNEDLSFHFAFKAAIYHAGQNLDPKFWWNSSYFCVSKLKVKYSFLLVNKKSFEDFHVSKLKVKIRIVFCRKAQKYWTLIFICFQFFTQFEVRQKSGTNFLMFFC